VFTDPDQRDEMATGIRRLIESSRLDSGCVDCRLYADVANPAALTLVDKWASRSDLERRLRSVAYGQLLQLLESSSEPPEFAFHTIAETTGLKTVREARIPVNPSAQRLNYSRDRNVAGSLTDPNTSEVSP